MNSIIRKLNVGLTGSLTMALGVNIFLVPYHLLDGGMIGIGLLLQYYFEFHPGLSILIISTPIFLVVYLYDRTLFLHSLYGLILSSLLIDLLSPFRDYILLPIPLHAIYGGSLIGLGIGIMLAYGMNTGGTDLIAQLLSVKLNLPIAVLIFLIDFLILFVGIHVIGMERTLYSFVTIVFVAIFTHYFTSRKLFG